ncbi:hypothetical protein GCM10022221_68320 [Actinocorallia aurea]
MGKKKTRTPEQDAEWDAMREQFYVDGQAAQEDPDVLAMVGRMDPSSHLATYSDWNRAFLAAQAIKRDMTLTEVYTANGWRAFGRHVSKGSKALRVAAPRGREDLGREETPADGSAAGQDEPRTRTLIRWLPVFDVSQTDPVEEVADVAATSEPATVRHVAEASPGTVVLSL